MVHFVGAGSGAVDLITVRGQRLLQEADVVIYAGSLVNPALLDNCKKECEIHDSAKLHLEEVIAIMKEAEAKNLTTVRLHTGDPAFYGAIKEQMDLLDAASISYDVCPGVSSMSGAAASLCAEYTLPGISQSVIITRAEGRTPVPQGQELKNMASHGSTMVLFLSSSLATKVQTDLIAGGYAKDTPVAIVYKATWPDEKIYRTTIENLASTMAEHNITKTALIIVGGVLDGVYELSKLYDKTFSTEFRKGITE